jgi:hypothetical protein
MTPPTAAAVANLPHLPPTLITHAPTPLPPPSLSLPLPYPSPAAPTRYLGVEFPTEDDVLHCDALPTFNNTLSREESEQLMSYLTVAYVRVPLILGFFASRDRVTYLFNPGLQALLRSVLFEGTGLALSPLYCLFKECNSRTHTADAAPHLVPRFHRPSPCTLSPASSHHSRTHVQAANGRRPRVSGLFPRFPFE